MTTKLALVRELRAQPFRQRYSNEDFDEVLHMAVSLTDIDRRHGKGPACGYSKRNVRIARLVMRRRKALVWSPR
jgi:hypothetical protein